MFSHLTSPSSFASIPTESWEKSSFLLILQEQPQRRFCGEAPISNLAVATPCSPHASPGTTFARAWEATPNRWSVDWAEVADLRRPASIVGSSRRWHRHPHIRCCSLKMYALGATQTLLKTYALVWKVMAESTVCRFVVWTLLNGCQIR